MSRLNLGSASSFVDDHQLLTIAPTTHEDLNRRMAKEHRNTLPEYDKLPGQEEECGYIDQELPLAPIVFPYGSDDDPYEGPYSDDDEDAQQVVVTPTIVPVTDTAAVGAIVEE